MALRDLLRLAPARDLDDGSPDPALPVRQVITFKFESLGPALTPEQQAKRDRDAAEWQERMDAYRRERAEAAAAVADAEAERRAPFEKARAAAIEAGEPDGPRPVLGSDHDARVARASRVEHGPWTDHLVAMQPVEDRLSDSRAMPEDVMDLRHTARLMAANGWSWYPQTRDEQRKPSGWGRVYRRQMMRRRDGTNYMGTRKEPSKVECYPKRFVRHAPGQILSDEWIQVAPSRSNVTIQCCEANLHAFVTDNDIELQPVSDRVDELRLEHLGPTPFDRVRADSCRRAHIYRLDPADAGTQIRKLLLGAAGSLEFFGQGRQITWHGRHYKTDAVFRSTGPLPGMDPGATPDLATVVTRAQLEAFRAAVAAEFAHLVVEDRRPASTGSPRVVGAVVDGRPVRRLEGLDYPGCPRDADGKVRHQRDQWMFQHAMALARVNRMSADQDVVDVMLEDLRDNVAFDGNTQDALEAKAIEKVLRKLGDTREWWAAKEEADERRRAARNPSASAPAPALPPPPPSTGTLTVAGVERVPVQHVPARCIMSRDMRALVPRLSDTTSLPALVCVLSPPDERAREERALLTDRGPVQAEVSRVIERALTRWVRRLYAIAMGEAKGKDVHKLAALAQQVMLIKGPTGSGKTTTLLRVLRQQKARARAAGFEGRVTVAMMVPNYNLLDEVQGKLDAAEAEADERARMAELEGAARAAGLDVMQYRGKRFTCGRQEEYRIVSDAGLGTGGMCESVSFDLAQVDGITPSYADFVRKPDRCQVWKDGLCDFQNQKLRIAQSDLVLLPTVYVTLPVPEELTQVAALVIDESVIGHFERTMTLDLDVFKVIRQPARLGEREKEEARAARPWSTEEEAIDVYKSGLMMDREEANEVARECILSGRDVALRLMTYVSHGDHRKSGHDLARTALSVNGRASDVHDSVTVDIDVTRARLLANRPRDAGLWAEIRFWRLVVERMDWLAADAAAAQVRADTVARWARLKIMADPFPAKVIARGDRDYRLRTLTDLETGKRTVSMSWRPVNRFAHLPTMLLDASANEDMLRKIWQGREVVPVEAPAPLHLRTLWVADKGVSLRSRLPYKHRDPAEAATAAERLEETRDIILGMAVVYGRSRIVVACPKQLEVAINTGWVSPPNVDWIHDGATVGLDFAKDHAAILVIGQTDIPTHALDARVGCWTYDDPMPEEPVDRLGTGVDEDGNEVTCPLVEVTTPLRDGRDVTTTMRRHAGRWARAVQEQTREEPQRQAIGRLRPVYRGGPESPGAPLVAIWGMVRPDGVVVDELTTGARLGAAMAHYAEAARVGCLPYRDPAFFAVDRGTPLTPRWDAVCKGWPDLRDDADAGATMGLSRFSYERPTGGRLEVLVPAYADPLAAVAAFERRSRGGEGLDPTTIELTADPANEPVDPKPIARKEDDKMTRLLGTMEARAAAAEATALLVAEMTAARAWPKDVFRRKLSDGALGILLTVRPRTDADPANVLATLRNPDAFPLAPPAPEPVAEEPVEAVAAETEGLKAPPAPGNAEPAPRVVTMLDRWREERERPFDLEWDTPVCRPVARKA